MPIKNIIEARLVGVFTPAEIHDIAISQQCGLDTIENDESNLMGRF